MSSKPFAPLDALRNDIKLGETYGYSSSANGFAKTAVGVATKITKTGLITLEISNVHHFLYGQPIDRTSDDAKTVNVRPHLLFPVGQ